MTGSVPQHQGRFTLAVLRPTWPRVGLASIFEVPGRVTGPAVRVTVVPWEVDGTWYLLSNYGVSDWVRNLQASGHVELRRKRRIEAFTAVEVEGEERDRQRPDRTDHPAFRVVPIWADA